MNRRQARALYLAIAYPCGKCSNTKLKATGACMCAEYERVFRIKWEILRAAIGHTEPDYVDAITDHPDSDE